MVEKIEEELGSALGGGVSKSKGIWIMCEGEEGEAFALGGDASGPASEYLGLGVGFSCAVIKGDSVKLIR